jgi:hypothetical protein
MLIATVDLLPKHMYYLHKKKVGVSLGTTRGGPKTNSSSFVFK